ncbi:ABC transporter ATP-binding protein [Halorussus sp. AFM4]|uniref:ABC transporter ATP-binding protein n=1 Tax=Halorussus sp. AFM4 TaxID=3421651 RepID=UPI003EB6DB9B
MNRSARDGSGSAIAVDDLTFTYPTGDGPALDDVSFGADEGEVLGVLGPVEAGKTTLSMALAGFVPEITGGRIEGGLSVAGRDPRSADDDRVAMVFEDYSAQLTQIRALDEVVAPLTNAGRSREAAESRALDLLDRVRLRDVAEKFTWELSGGQQQRLAIAAALAVDPEVLVFDTATDMLDPEGRRSVADLVASLAGETTLVVTANDPDELVGIADRVVVLDGGEVVASGPTREVLTDAALLSDVGVDPPVALDVARRVGLDASPLTADEFARAVSADGRRTPVAPDGAGRTGSAGGAGDSGAASRDGDDAVLSVEGCTYEYPDGTVALSGVDLSVGAGEVHAILGGNGAGKTTLSKLLVGLQRPTSGRVVAAGTDTAEATARDLAEDVGIALQNPDEQLNRQTVVDEIRYPLEKRRYERRGPLGLLGRRERYDEAFVDERVETVVDLLGLGDVREADPVFLPQGERRLVTMAAALATDPAAVVLDEPAAGVDAASQRVIEDAIRRLRDDGTAVVVIDHDMAFVCEIADRVTVLDDGEVAMQGPVREVFAPENRDRLADRYLRPPKAARLARRVGVDALTRDDLVEALAAEGGVSA